MKVKGWGKWARNQINRGNCVQIACTYSNVCCWPYLTTSGRVYREEYGYVEDTEAAGGGEETLDLPPMEWARIRRIQGILAYMYNE